MLYTQNLDPNNGFKGLNAKQTLQIEQFLTSSGIANYTVQPIVPDASYRRYYRIITNTRTVILMDASDEIITIEPFLKIAQFLNDCGLHAPNIYHYNLEQGFILMEDLGKYSYTETLSQDTGREDELYSLALEVLKTLYHADITIDIPEYTSTLLNNELSHFTDWYLNKHIASSKLYSIATAELIEIFNSLYGALKKLKPTITLRDFHADNLMYVQNAAGIKQVGILDFQSATIGSPVYDLVSLLEDARRDITHQVSMDLKERYKSELFLNYQEEFDNSYIILSAQRNLKIIGIFHKLIYYYNREHYNRYLPKVRTYLLNSLEHPILINLKKWCRKYKVLFS